MRDHGPGTISSCWSAEDTLTCGT